MSAPEPITLAELVRYLGECDYWLGYDSSGMYIAMPVDKDSPAACGTGSTPWEAANDAMPERQVAPRDEAAELKVEVQHHREPDYLYNPDDGEYTVPWGERHLFDAEIEDSRGVVRYRTAYDGPDVFAASVPVEFDDAGWPVRSETQWFDSQEAAEEALLRVAAPEEQP